MIQITASVIPLRFGYQCRASSPSRRIIASGITRHEAIRNALEALGLPDKSESR